VVQMRQIQELADAIVREFAPERIILFGSRAYGEPRDDSDVDLLVILPFNGRPLEKSLEILDRTDPHFPIDLVTRAPEDVNRRYEEGDPLIREALDRGVVLYERNPQGVGV
jgi:predicted nucleotidyltransferase